ncbi:lipocalin-like domain-containing protein [Haloflavibacter putidus]|uniref:Lipocalin family protein n=1 Tax=Haloflavibacter putidus TaxID=2576776 RepID=A0A508A360_9FLAO|nr:lipocalin family protein [Haloflavibacter putidus]TQD40282.1 lipocalin family protein [Haloflavibacter putidus]
MKIYNFKVVQILLCFGVLFFASKPFFAQSLEGKWNIAKIDTRHSTLIEFTKDSIFFYEFDKRRSATAYQVKDNRLIVDKTSVPIAGEFEFVNSQRLRLKPNKAKKTIDFVRLKPTKTSLTKDEITQMKFEINYRERAIPIIFDQAEDKTSKAMRLEKLDATYFISFYRETKRKGALAIESISPKKIMIYGFPEEPFVVSGVRLNSTESMTHANTVSALSENLPIAKALVGMWFYKSIEGRPSLSKCTKKTFFRFTEDLKIETKPYAKDFSNGNCVAGSTINGTYKINGDKEIEVTQNGKTEIWKILSLSKTILKVEKDGRALVLAKQ